MLNVILYQPEIPQNTGNIGRLTQGTGAKFIIIGEPGFDLENNRAAKRAGLDYWKNVKLTRYSSWENYINNTSGPRFVLSKFAETPYYAEEFPDDSHFIFGGETRGIPDNIYNDDSVTPICLPMNSDIRSYNLANSVSAVLFYALGQNPHLLAKKSPYTGQRN